MLVRPGGCKAFDYYFGLVLPKSSHPLFCGPKFRVEFVMKLPSDKRLLPMAGNSADITVWLLSFLATSLFVFISYLWLDRPIARWVQDNIHLHQEVILKPLAQAPNPLVILSAIGFVILGLKALSRR